MRVWRVVQERFAAQALTGAGARLRGGRWNPEGVPLVYAAESCALAVLEIRVNLITRPRAPYVAVEVEVSDAEVSTPGSQGAPAALPDDWARTPYSPQTQALGLEWIHSGMKDEATAGLAVPSATLPLESIVLLNPLHPRFAGAAKVVASRQVHLDPRLF